MGTPNVAFISYSRKDKDIADWLHDKMENYEIPEYIRVNTPLVLSGKFLRKVFIDRQDLHVEVRPFGERLQLALCDSQFLIVLCSKNSARSEFVNREIEYFLDRHDRNYSRIIPLFIDDVDDLSIPPSLKGTSIMERHFPIYNSRLDKSSEANAYCFYQIVAYMLNVDFAEIYNRYEIQVDKQLRSKKKKNAMAIAFLTVVLCMLGCYHYIYSVKSREVIDQKQRLIDFEKKVFPASVVHGYEHNFLTPVINCLKNTSGSFCVFVLMPKNERELSHPDRILDFSYDAKQKIGIDSLYTEFLSGGNRIIRVINNGRLVDGVYLDFATTTTSFLDIAKYKKGHPEYDGISIDSIVFEYSCEFIGQTNDQLKGDSIYVKFFMDKSELIRALAEEL